MSAILKIWNFLIDFKFALFKVFSYFIYTSINEEKLLKEDRRLLTIKKNNFISFHLIGFDNSLHITINVAIHTFFQSESESFCGVRFFFNLCSKCFPPSAIHNSARFLIFWQESLTVFSEMLAANSLTTSLSSGIVLHLALYTASCAWDQNQKSNGLRSGLLEGYSTSANLDTTLFSNLLSRYFKLALVVCAKTGKLPFY